MAIYEEKYNAIMTSLNELKTQQGKIISTIICQSDNLMQFLNYPKKIKS